MPAPLNPTLFELRGLTIFYASREIFTLGTADDAFHYFTALRNGDTTVAGSIGRLHEQQAKQGSK
jgi:hypothetical protein